MIPIPKWLADLGLRVNRLYYKNRFESIYLHNGVQSPSWFDHRIDLYYIWPQNLFWLERGILPRKYMFQGCKLLDLCCGDGFYSRYFYSSIAGSIDAIDKDPSAIDHAKRLHSHPNIHFHAMDAVIEDLPSTQYDVVVWFEAIEHLSEEAYGYVIRRIKTAMASGGVLFGSTPIVPEEKKGQGNWEHENEFSSVVSLQEFLERDFSSVSIETTVYPEFFGNERKTAYFTAKSPRI